MTILLTGGTGRTSTVVAKLLLEAGETVLLTSRRGQAGVAEGHKGVTFDWNDASTFANPFEHSSIDKVYLIGPASVPKPFPIMKPFIDLAVEKGVTKFVLLSTSFTEKGGEFGQGKTHEYLAGLGSDVEYHVIRPCYFFGTSS
jgi:festuclavine dehydrogenase